jgi:hypothetical protein
MVAAAGQLPSESADCAAIRKTARTACSSMKLDGARL